MFSASSPELVPSSTAPQLEPETLHEGDQGASVTQLQTQLKSLGFYQANISGKFDTPTKQALEAFQTQYGISREFGFFGPQTWYALTFWSQETTWPIPSPLPAIKRSLKTFIESAGHQPVPLWSTQAQPQPEIMPGQQLFWPPFNRKRISADSAVSQ
ncbi:MAG: peptidoglycan-binding domain-containing protein [Cyanobacteria bacterium J06632_3]